MLKELPPTKSRNYQEIVDSARQLQLSNRQIFDKANRAFVSYIQSYSKHECNLILRVKGTRRDSLLFSPLLTVLLIQFL